MLLFIFSFSRKLKLPLCIVRMEKKVLNTITHFAVCSNGDNYNPIGMKDRMYVILQASSYGHLGIKQRCISDKTVWVIQRTARLPALSHQEGDIGSHFFVYFS